MATTTTSTDTAEGSLNLFFYIKGSKDFPTGHLISEKFGYADSSAEAVNDLTYSSKTAVFQNTIKDVILRTKNAREVNNMYSLYSDASNCIPIRSASKNSRSDRSQEFISTMIIANGDTTGYNHIYPNYSASLSKITAEAAQSEGSTKVPLRESAFWQKMFTLLEFLKSQELNIITTEKTGDNPALFAEKATDTTWFGDSNGSKYTNCATALASETAIGKYIALFIAGNTNDGVFAANTESENDGYNPFRITYTHGTETYSNVDDSEKDEERLWNPTKGLNIQYVPKSATFIHSSIENRIAYCTFKVKYQSSTSRDSMKTWRITAYFDPDSFINNTGTGEFSVWTYNDSNLDGRYNDYLDEGFNILDNDYANIMSDDDSVKNNFVVTQSELEKSIIDAVVEKMHDGNYAGYSLFTTLRVTPFLQKNEKTDCNEIVWDESAHSRAQTFFVFYTNAAPTQSQMMTAVQDYLKNLHKDCNPTTYETGNPSSVRFIGHGAGTGEAGTAEEVNFLSKMYPNLFSSTTLHIIPIHANMCTNGTTSEANKFDPTKYYHTLTPDRLVTTLHSINEFKSFILEEDGSVVLDSSNPSEQKALPVEIFYIGGLKTGTVTDGNNNDSLTFDFPWICTMKGTSTTNPLTTQSGFGSYRQKLFDGNQSEIAEPDELFQYIMILLSMKMFTNDDNKHRYNKICNTTMEYEVNITDDNNISLRGCYNVVKFTINHVEFVVHAQLGKNFGSITQTAIDA